jgi:hypothetical protein
MRPLRPGDPVVVLATGECGVVVHTWESKHADEVADHYVALFGKKFPWGKPSRIPYVLRCAASSLRAVVTDEVDGAVRWRLPLHAAIEEGDLASARVLLRGGAEPDVLDGALLRAVVHPGAARAVRLLLRHGADVNAHDARHWTALHYAASVGPLDVVKLLLASGADAHAADSQGLTPVLVAAGLGRGDVARLLGAKAPRRRRRAKR